MTVQEIESAVEFCPLLKGFGIPSKLMTARGYRNGQIVSDQMEGQSSVCLVVSGLIDVYSVAVDGRDVRLNTLGPGECFGISNLLAPANLETVLRCRMETVLIFIPKKALIAAMEKDSALALRYAAYCNQKIQFLLHRIELLTMQSCRGKVIAYLLSQRRHDNTVRPNGSREDLARQLGISRAALFREMSYLQAQGLLVSEGSAIRITDPTALEQLLYQRPGC